MDNQITNRNIHNSTVSNNITNVLANLSEYNEWKVELTLALKTFASLSKDEAELKSIYENRIESFRRKITDYEKLIKDAFNEIKVDLQYQQDALDELGNLKFEKAVEILLSRTKYIEEVENKIELKSNEIEKSKRNISMHYLLLAVSVQSDKNYLDYFEKISKYFELSIHNYPFSISYLGYASFLQLNAKRLDKCEQIYIDCLKSFEFQLTEEEKSWVYNNLGVIYKNQQKYSKAMTNYKKALVIRKRNLKESNKKLSKEASMGDFENYADTLTNIGILCMEKKEFKIAIEKYLQLATNIYIQIYTQSENDYAFHLVRNGLLLADAYRRASTSQSESVFRKSLEWLDFSLMLIISDEQNLKKNEMVFFFKECIYSLVKWGLNKEGCKTYFKYTFYEFQLFPLWTSEITLNDINILFNDIWEESIEKK